MVKIIAVESPQPLLIRPCHSRYAPRLPLTQGHRKHSEEVNRFARLDVRERDWEPRGTQGPLTGLENLSRSAKRRAAMLIHEPPCDAGHGWRRHESAGE